MGIRGIARRIAKARGIKWKPRTRAIRNHQGLIIRYEYGPCMYAAPLFDRYPEDHDHARIPAAERRDIMGPMMDFVMRPSPPETLEMG